MSAIDIARLRESAGAQAAQETSRRQARDLPPASQDGFARALMLERRALCDALATAEHGIRHQLIPLLEDVYGLLRSPVYPKDGPQRFLDLLLAAATGDATHVQLHGVLASPTAMAEARYILHCAALFRRHGITPRVMLFLVRWENLVEIGDQDVAARAQTFAQQIRGVTQAALLAGYADAVAPIDVHVDAATGIIQDPIDFHRWSRRVADAGVDPRGADPSLAKDAAWSAAFYARQASLSRLGAQQALLDLAIRRAVGRRISVEQQPHAPAAMVTLELHKRFLPCYAASMPIVNLDPRTCARSAAMSAIA